LTSHGLTTHSFGQSRIRAAATKKIFRDAIHWSSTHRDNKIHIEAIRFEILNDAIKASNVRGGRALLHEFVDEILR
jgi:hypothetical protein